MHNHCNSIFSGVFYFDSFERSGTHFYKKNATIERIENILGISASDNFDIFNIQRYCNIMTLPKKNKLVIFPSYLEHSMEKHKLKKTRYSFAFNSYFDGVISNTNTCLLDFKTITVKEKNQRFLKTIVLLKLNCYMWTDFLIFASGT